MKQKYLDAAEKIAQQLLAKKKTGVGYSWDSIHLVGKQQQWQETSSIYSGAAGIVYFFIQLYKITKKQEYKDTALQGALWLMEKSEKSYDAFITGDLGVAYVFLDLWHVTGDKQYLSRSLHIAKEAKLLAINEYINGNSGALFCLLRLHAATKEEWLLSKIDLYIKYIIEHIYPSAHGLYWDRSGQQIRGLCGFSHGAAGIGDVFLEVGKYFNNPAFYWLAEQAFAYENQWYDESKENWPDFRKGIWDEKSEKEHREAYEKNDLTFFTRPGDMNAWCHGAAGIGLSRIRAYEILKKDEYKKDIERAITRLGHPAGVLREDMTPAGWSGQKQGSFTLCHGAGGNAEIFLEAYLLFKDKKYLDDAYAVADSVVGELDAGRPFISGYGSYTDKEDVSLFMGNAGIGYFLLRCYSPQIVPSILSPRINIKDAVSVNPEIYAHIALSMKLLEKKLAPVSRVQQEKRKLELIDVSNAYREIERRVRMEKAGDLIKNPDTQFEQLLLRVDRYARLINEDGKYYILFLTPSGCDVLEVNQFCYKVLAAYGGGKRVKEVFSQIYSLFGTPTEEEQKMINAKVIEQTKELLKYGILYC